MDVSGKLIPDNFQYVEQSPYAMKFARATTRWGNNEPVCGEAVARVLRKLPGGAPD
jgi:hypothetical protein